MGGRNGMMPADYAALSDRQIIVLLQIEWDDEGRLITEAEEAGQESGSIARAHAELASPEQLGLSEQELAWALSLRPGQVDTFYLSMFWSVWQRRGKSNEEIRRIWMEHLASDH